MAKDPEPKGIWRRITGEQNNPSEKRLTVFLACGHHLIFRTDTELGQSITKTAWKQAQCWQCDGTEYVPE